TVTIHLVGGQELATAAALTVTISGVADTSGNVMAAPLQVGGSVSGDSTAPVFAGAFFNWREDPLGFVIDVRFSEDVDAAFAADATRWSTSGGATPQSVELPEKDHARLTFSSVLAPSETIGLVGLPDLAGNASGSISIDPQE